MADQTSDPYAATAIKPAKSKTKTAPAPTPMEDPYAATAMRTTSAAPTASSSSPTSSLPYTTGTIRPLTERERFLNPNLYPVGLPNEGLGENLYNIAQRGGVGIFQLADAATHPRDTVAGILASLLPEPAVHVVNRVANWGKSLPIPGSKYMWTNLPEQTENPLHAAYQAVATSRGPMELAGKAAPLAGQALAGDVFGVIVPEVFRDVRVVPEKVARAMTNTGAAPVEQLVEDTRLANEKIDAVNADRTEAHAKANATATAEYNKAVGKVIQDRRAAAATTQARAHAAAQTRVVGSQLIYRINRLNESLRTHANQLYSAVQEHMAGASIPSDTLANAVKAAQDRWIRGSPEKVREFNAMVSPGQPGPELVLADQTAQNMGYKDFRTAITNPAIRSTLSRALPPDVWEAAIGQGTRPISWNDLQGFYEETGARIADGPQPGKSDIYKALQQVHQFVGDQMQQLAGARDVGDQFRDARNFYREYMQTFHTPTGPSSSGSAVAQVLRAKDPAVAVQKFSGTAADRAISDLNRYDPALAQLARQAQKIKQETPTATAAARMPKSITSVPVPTTVPLELRPHETISSPDIAAARRAAAEARANKIWNRGQWAATWPIFQAARAFWGGHIPSIPTMALESAGMLAAVQATTHLMRYPPMLRFLEKARPEDIPLIPPEMRGDLPGLVHLAQQQGIKVAPALVAAAAATPSDQQSMQSTITPTQAIQAMQSGQSNQSAAQNGASQ